MKLFVAFLLIGVTLVHSQDSCNPGKPCIKKTQRCFNGKCQDKLTCNTVNCVRGTKCLNDPIRCLAPCKTSATCKDKEKCRNGYCEDALTCNTVKCKADYKCRTYPIRCLKPCTANNKCPSGYNCIDAYCEKKAS